MADAVELEKGGIGGAWPSPGQWAPLRHRGRPTAMVRCPRCKHLATLHDHEIDASGKVDPSLECPTPECDWHVWATLLSWEG